MSIGTSKGVDHAARHHVSLRRQLVMPIGQVATEAMEQLTDGIINRQWSWNGAFGNQSVVVGDDGPLSAVTLAGGMKVTLLSPHWPALEALRPVWKKECEKAGLIPGVQAEAEVDDGL